jgi:hypothetical protein
MPLLLSQLLTQSSEEAIIALLFEGAGIDSASWHKTSVRAAVLRGCARGLWLAQTTVTNVVQGGLLGLSKTFWLTLLGEYYYQDPRQPAIPTIRRAVLSLPASASPVIIPDGTRIPEKVSGREWIVRNIELVGADISITPGALPYEVHLVSAIAGEVGNVAPSTVLRPNVPALVAAFVNADPVQTGSNEESDERYTLRLSLKWSLNTYAVGPRAYMRIALDAAPSVSQVRVLNNYPLRDDIRIALRRATGPAFPEDVALVQAAAELRAALNDLPLASIAPTVPVPILMQPRILRGTSTAEDCRLSVVNALNTMPIGGHKVAGSDAGRLLRDYLAQAVLCKLNGVTSAGVVTPAVDEVLGATDIVDTSDVTIEPEFYDWIV